MSTTEDLVERVERLLLRHEELQRTHELLTAQLASTSSERDNLRSRLNAARSRIDVLLERLPRDAVAAAEAPENAAVGNGHRAGPAEPRMKQVEVTILGQSYILGCPDGGEVSLHEAVATVDREMSAIRDGGRVKARERIAVLAALNLAFALAERGGGAGGRRVGRKNARPPGLDPAHRHGPERRWAAALIGT